MKLLTIYIWMLQASLLEQREFLEWISCMKENDVDVIILQNISQLQNMQNTETESGLLLTDDADAIKLTLMSYVILLDEYSLRQTLPEGAYCIEALTDMDAEYFVRVYKRKHHLPWDILETRRLKIREITLQDVEILEKLYEDPEITQYLEPLFPLEKEREYTENYIKYVYGFYGYGMWVVEEKETGQLIGRVGLESKEGFDGLELGFMLGKKYWHKGYAREMCEAVLRYGQDELEIFSYRALVCPENEKSIRLCEKLGFSRYGMQELYMEMRMELEGKA